MSLFPIPAKVEDRLDKLRRDFLWLGNKEGKGLHLVKWQNVKLQKQSGGLGIRNLRLQNKSLLSKWLWRFTTETHALWREVIVCKYGLEGNWCSNSVNNTYGVSMWRTTRNLWPDLSRNIAYKVGSGTKTLFWKENWIGNVTLMEMFPDLFSLRTNSEETEAKVWSQQGWNIAFRRFLNDWEIGKVAELLKVLNGCTELSEEEDSIKWRHNRDGMLSVNRLYTREVKELQGCRIGPWKKIWKTKVPNKIKCFSWLVARRACSTHERLKKKGLQIVSWCSLCNEVEETYSHLFLHCRVTTRLWNLFLGATQTEWIMPEHTSDLLSCWIRREGSKTQKKCGNIILSCMWCSIWKERNNRCFENKANPIDKVKWLYMSTFYFWSKEEGLEEDAQIREFIGNL